MKQQHVLKSMLCLLMGLVCNAVWAETLEFTSTQFAKNTYTHHGNASGAWYGKFVTNSTPSLTVESTDETANNIGYSSNRPWLKAGYTYNITIPDSYRITGYTLTTQSTSSGYTNTYTYTTAEGTSISEAQAVNTDKTVTVTGLNTEQIQLVINGSAGGLNYGILITGLTVTYGDLITYTLSDDAGNSYTGSYVGVAGETLPPLTGVVGYTLSNEQWDGNNFTATITFPFPVSKEGTTNPTIISSFKGGGGSYSGDGHFKWYADGDDVKILRDATVTPASVEAYMWAIYPTLKDGAFTYTIKSVKTGQYISSTASFASGSGSHAEGTVTLSDTPTEFSLSTDGNNRLYYVTNDLNHYLSWGSTNDESGYLGVYAKEHNGTKNSFHDAAYTVTTDANGNAAIYTPIAVTIPEGVTAYTGTLNVAKSFITLNEIADAIPAQTAVVLKGAASTTYTFTATDEAAAIEDNDLVGATSDVNISGITTGTPYILSSNAAAFVQTKADIAAYSAYIVAEEAADALPLLSLSNTAMYKVYGSRGFIYATDGDTPELKGTNVASVDYDTTNLYHNFAIIEEEGNYYLYNVGAKKFVIKSGTTAALSDTPDKQTFAIGAASSLTTAYDLVIYFNGSLAHLSNAATNGVYTNSTSQDEGTRWEIAEVGTFDPEEALYVIRNYDRQLPVKAEVEGLEATNPNTHFGNVTIGDNSTKIKRALGSTNETMTLTSIDYNGLEEDITVEFTRAYRGFEFQGYWLGDEELGTSFTLTEERKGAITEENPLIAKFKATSDVTLFYDDDEKSYRIPAIATTGTGRIIAVSDYRHNLDDVGRDKHGTGTKRIDLVARTSDDNGKTWSDTMIIAAGNNDLTGQGRRIRNSIKSGL